jgi:hypothetical protein
MKGLVMNRLATIGVALAIALIGPASAETLRYLGPPPSPAMVAGEVGQDGMVLHGSGFTARRMAAGQYEVHFQNGVLRRCASMVATAEFHFLVASAKQRGCGERFIVEIGTDSRGRVDDNFQFIAVEDQP